MMFINNNKYSRCLKDSIVIGELRPAFDNNNIPVVFASDNNYVKYLSVAIISLTDNMSKDYNYDIVILEDKIKDKSKKLLLEQVKDFKNVSLRFIDINKYFDENKDIEFYSPKIISYITRSMYNRLFIPEIFDNYEKVIYLDTDILINDSLVELYNTNLGNCLIGGVRHIEFDPIFDINKKGSIKESNRLSKLYNISNYSSFFYINSGIILYDIRHCNEYNFVGKSLKFVKLCKNALYPDQDAINRICYRRIYYIDYVYNFNPCNLNKVKINPKIFHFYGGGKPWKLLSYTDIKPIFLNWIKTSFRSPFFKSEKRELVFTKKFKSKLQLVRYKICSKIYKSKKRMTKYKRKIENTEKLIKFIEIIK